ncbi:peptide/nickel transport system substrate-binding protein [Streptomonospora nanhaiensis]|uniref:Peptide/nickel transport system substrate-binding protein n=1 Tax=Streptomonospora nanhaiensis TaxID=1323731 RepID=A0A853BHQ1_9ACTN|nr:ABC transporter substrate-binding protein [Streptomonospora nanhaiensis]NYI95008.1 peptide/nickel transport system substrate-binding protein [Streptomonospora nanhaiensis]
MARSQDRPGRRAAAALSALKTSSAAVLAAALAALPAAPAAASPGAGGGEGDTLTIAVSQPVDSLSPFLAQRLISTNIHRLAYDYLTNYDPETNEPIPALAESWETTDEGRTWTFTIRDDVEWSDGEPLTAEDIAWTYTTMMEDEGAATANGNFVANFESATAVDDTTLRIELAEPQATMLALDIPIVPKHVWEDVEDFGAFNNDEDFPIVGSGPFVITDHRPNQSITLEANEDYWRDPPKFDRLVFRYMPEKDAQVEALRAGEVSFIADLTPAQADALGETENIAVNEATGKRFQAFTVNPGARTQDGEEFGDGHPALTDRVLRQAIMRAIDKNEIVESVYGGYAEPAGGYIPARYEDYHWEPGDDDPLGFDVEAANEMLDEAGYERGDDGVRVSPDGDRLELRLHVHNDRPDYVAMGRLIDERLADIGIEIDNQTVDPGVLSDALYNGTYDLIFTGWSVNPDPDYVLGIHTCDALPVERGTMRTDAYFCDEEYDRLYEQQLANYDDPEGRAEQIRQMQEILYEEAVVNVLTYADVLEAYRTDQISDIQVQPDPGGNIWGQDGHWAWTSATPAEPAAAAGPGVPTWALAGVGVLVLVAVVGGVVLLRRRSATAEDRE